MLTHRDVYELIGTVLACGGYADGTPRHPEVRDPARFAELAADVGDTLAAMGVEVEAGPFPVLPHDPHGVPGKYVVIRAINPRDAEDAPLAARLRDLQEDAARRDAEMAAEMAEVAATWRASVRPPDLGHALAAAARAFADAVEDNEVPRDDIPF